MGWAWEEGTGVVRTTERTLLKAFLETDVDGQETENALPIAVLSQQKVMYPFSVSGISRTNAWFCVWRNFKEEHRVGRP